MINKLGSAVTTESSGDDFSFPLSCTDLLLSLLYRTQNTMQQPASFLPISQPLVPHTPKMDRVGGFGTSPWRFHVRDDDDKTCGPSIGIVAQPTDWSNTVWIRMECSRCSLTEKTRGKARTTRGGSTVCQKSRRRRRRRRTPWHRFELFFSWCFVSDSLFSADRNENGKADWDISLSGRPRNRSGSMRGRQPAMPPRSARRLDGIGFP